MKPSMALAHHRNVIQETAHRYRVSNARVFGSVASGTDTETSDLDILVDPSPETTLLDLGGLQDELENTMGIKVHLVTPGDLPPRFREQVIANAVRI